MKHRYKYRGKTWKGKWVYGYPVYLIQENYEEGIIDGIRTWWDGNEDVDPETVGQCTGRTDKDGTLIYEGDKVLANKSNSYLGDSNDIYVVEWSEPYDMWVLRTINSDNPNRIGKVVTKANGQPYILSNVKKIIGTIHDNETE